MTFDYKFDVYKTPLMRCLCGTASCKGYLGLKPMEMTNAEWDNKLDNLPCEVCKTNNYGNDNLLIMCDGCNSNFHIDCLVPKLLSIPIDQWFCDFCKL